MPWKTATWMSGAIPSADGVTMWTSSRSVVREAAEHGGRVVLEVVERGVASFPRGSGSGRAIESAWFTANRVSRMPPPPASVPMFTRMVRLGVSPPTTNSSSKLTMR